VATELRTAAQVARLMIGTYHRHPIHRRQTMKKTLFAAALVAAIGLAPAGAEAQFLSFGVAGGPTIPLGATADEVGTGFNAGIFADVNIPLLPVGGRADLLFHQMSADGHDLQVIGGTLNAKLRMPLILVSPYLIGGVGMYASKFEDTAHAGESHDWETNVGLNGGVGVQLRLFGFGAFAEARLQNVFGDESRRFLPITFGFSF
jgi:hypothetical protein